MKALELDETVPYAHSMLGRIAFQYDWDFARAGREFARARELDPTLTHAWFAAYLMAHLFENFVQENLTRHLGHIFNIFGDVYEHLLLGIGVLMIYWLMLFWMYRRKIFLRV